MIYLTIYLIGVIATWTIFVSLHMDTLVDKAGVITASVLSALWPVFWFSVVAGGIFYRIHKAFYPEILPKVTYREDEEVKTLRYEDAP